MSKKILFKNILGDFLLDHKYDIVKGNPNHSREPEDKETLEVLSAFRKKEYIRSFRDANIRLTKARIKDSLTEDIFILQTSSSIDEITKIINMLTKRLREWTAYPFPELSERCKDNEVFVREVISFPGPDKEDKMSSKIEDIHLKEIKKLADTIKRLIEEKESLERYMEKLMQKLCKNVYAVAGGSIGAKLLVLCGGIERLAMAPASKIQLLGAEEALFRHIKSGAKPPKHGILHEHRLVSSSRHSDKGKIARRLADKISIAAKIDFFKGDFIGDKLIKDLEKQVKKG